MKDADYYRKVHRQILSAGFRFIPEPENDDSRNKQLTLGMFDTRQRRLNDFGKNSGR